MKKSQNFSRSVFRAIKILNSISDGNKGITPIADTLDLDKGTVHRILKSMENTGIIIQSIRDRKYYVGPLIYKLASNPLITHQILIDCAFEEMTSLRDKFKGTLCILIPRGIYGVFIELVESKESVRATTYVGNYMPLHIGAGGKVILSQYTDKELELFFKWLQIKYPETIEMGLKTITMDQLRNLIMTTREAGYCITHDEVAGGIGIAVPIFKYICPAALVLLFPAIGHYDRIGDVIEDLKHHSNLITSKLEQLSQYMAVR